MRSFLLTVLAIGTLATTTACGTKGSSKAADTSAEVTAPVTETNEFRGTKWRLVEIMGQPVDALPADQRQLGLEFDAAENRLAAFGGCNSMAGGYTLSAPGRISIGPVARTMMACPDMTLEDQLAQVLETADSYYLSEESLTLVRARMAPLARFVPIAPTAE